MPDTGWRLWLKLTVALVGLNLAVSFYNVWPTPWVTTRHEISVEAAALVVLMALYAEWRRPPSGRALGWLAVLFTLLALGRYAEVTAPALYGRPVNLYWDAQHLPRVAAMLVGEAPFWLTALFVCGAAALLGGLFLLLRWMLCSVGAALAQPLSRRVVLGVSGALVALFAAGHLNERVHTLGWFSLPVTLTYAGQAARLREALVTDDVAPSMDAPPLASSRLERLAGADLMIIFLESYGATTFDRPEYARALADTRAALGETLARSDRQAVSAYVRSPTFGGASWLAHASFLAGVEVTDNRRYERLLIGQRETLVHRFAGRGYRTLALMPGLRHAWPEGRFYNFAKIYDATTLDYRGPEFGWWRIPDQYALARLDAAELTPGARAPVLLFFPTISSHLPFRPTPPYKSDWQAMLGPEPYGPAGPDDGLTNQSVDWSGLGAAYVASVNYALTYLAGYLQTRAPPDLVLLVLGDHQPAATISGPGAPWDVPVHVITRRSALTDALRAEGFQDGLQPRRPVIGPMHALTAKLLRAFGGEPAAPGDSAAPMQASVNVPGSGSRRQTFDSTADATGVTPPGSFEPMTLAR